MALTHIFTEYPGESEVQYFNRMAYPGANPNAQTWLLVSQGQTGVEGGFEYTTPLPPEWYGGKLFNGPDETGRYIIAFIGANGVYAADGEPTHIQFIATEDLTSQGFIQLVNKQWGQQFTTEKTAFDFMVGQGAWTNYPVPQAPAEFLFLGQEGGSDIENVYGDADSTGQIYINTIGAQVKFTVFTPYAGPTNITTAQLSFVDGNGQAAGTYSLTADITNGTNAMSQLITFNTPNTQYTYTLKVTSSTLPGGKATLSIPWI